MALVLHCPSGVKDLSETGVIKGNLMNNWVVRKQSGGWGLCGSFPSCYSGKSKSGISICGLGNA